MDLFTAVFLGMVAGFCLGMPFAISTAYAILNVSYDEPPQEYRVIDDLDGWWRLEHRPVRTWFPAPWKRRPGSFWSIEAAEEAAARLSLGPKYLGVFRPHEETKA